MSAVDRAAVERLAAEPIDWATATVESAPAGPVSMVYSTRLDSDLAGRLVAEAERRGVKPAALLRELVALGLPEPGAVGGDAGASVPLADLRQAVRTLASTIESAAHRAA